MDIKEQLKDIKTQLRLSMNGAVSQSMREKIGIQTQFRSRNPPHKDDCRRV